MIMNESNFLYQVKQIVTGTNGTLGDANTGTAKAADGGFKLDNAVALNTVGAGGASQITDSTGGTASTTLAAIIAGAGYAQADMIAVKNALASIAKQLNLLSFTSSETSALILSIPSGTNPVIGAFAFPIPRDYDEASDNYIVRVIVSLANADASITLKGVPTIKHIGTAATLGSAVYATLPFSSSAPATTTAQATALTTTETAYELVFSGNGLKRDDVIYVALSLSGTTTGATNVYAVENTYDSTLVSYNQTDTSGVDGSLAAYGNPLR